MHDPLEGLTPWAQRSKKRWSRSSALPGRGDAVAAKIGALHGIGLDLPFVPILRGLEYFGREILPLVAPAA